MNSQNEKTVFITGSSSGLGRATAKLFASKGWKVIATMRDPEKESELNKLTRVALLPLDITDQEQIESTVKRAINMGEVDVVFNNAGYGLAGPLEGLTDEQIIRMINTNLIGAIRTTKAFVPYFRAKRAGLFINTTSIGGLITVPFNSIYHATKWALEGWSESMVFELSQFGIGMKTVEPGGMKTDFFTRSFDTRRHEAYNQLVDKVMGMIRDPKQMETLVPPGRLPKWCTKPPLTEKTNSATSPATTPKQRTRCVCSSETKPSARRWLSSFSGSEHGLSLQGSEVCRNRGEVKVPNRVPDLLPATRK